MACDLRSERPSQISGCCNPLQTDSAKSDVHRLGIPSVRAAIMSNLIIGVDLESTRFELAIANAHFEIQSRKRLNRAQFASFCRDLTPSLIVMEACSTAHYWGRTLQSWGHRVRLLPAQYVAAYVRRNKTDAADAAALIEANRCYELRAVPIKSIAQQRLMQLHRLREQYKRTRNARVSLLRSAFREFGVLMPSGRQRSLMALREALHGSPTVLPAALVAIYVRVLEEIEHLQENIRAIETALRTLTRRDPIVRGLRQICGVGPLIATALRGAVGDIERFRSGRHFASWLGLTAREYSTGGRQHLGRISRRGDRYLRTLLVNGARSALMAANRFYCTGDRRLDRVRAWAVDIQRRCGINRATVALANKLARIIWATWRYQRPFDGNWQTQLTPSG